MKNVTIKRGPSASQGTFGVMTTDQSQDVFATGELPWENNKPDISCIPSGTYTCRITSNERMTELFERDLYEILGIPGRFDCFIHGGNWCGDVSQGYRSDVEGCIIIGLTHGILAAQEAVLSSRVALKEFMALMGGEDFLLTIC